MTPFNSGLLLFQDLRLNKGPKEITVAFVARTGWILGYRPLATLPIVNQL